MGDHLTLDDMQQAIHHCITPASPCAVAVRPEDYGRLLDGLEACLPPGEPGTFAPRVEVIIPQRREFWPEPGQILIIYDRRIARALAKPLDTAAGPRNHDGQE